MVSLKKGTGNTFLMSYLSNPFDCTLLPGSLEASDHKSAAHSLPDHSPAPQTKQPQPFQQQDDNFLPSPLCSSLLLELPPSPAVINPSQVVPAPPPLPICTSPSPSTRKSRKRRAPAQFDAADWLETLTSGLHPLTPPKPPFVESDFSLDWDLNVNRVLDLLIEQWWRCKRWCVNMVPWKSIHIPRTFQHVVTLQLKVSIVIYWDFDGSTQSFQNTLL